MEPTLLGYPSIIGNTPPVLNREYNPQVNEAQHEIHERKESPNFTERLRRSSTLLFTAEMKQLACFYARTPCALEECL
ncbi:hypothetical protein CesoFtcFv8_015374 [Champsocephalus esox]|uniref:Uncharacterized protein n=1 Tax=Champsocephalus esox TaxID=159716 RepID=A0AAN8BQU9_9TELE|nr:hypothetical protein CesoFtcFv8_015374 [Champsocephalus esox]